MSRPLYADSDPLDPTEDTDLYECTPDLDPDLPPFEPPATVYIAILTGRPLPAQNGATL